MNKDKFRKRGFLIIEINILLALIVYCIVAYKYGEWHDIDGEFSVGIGALGDFFSPIIAFLALILIYRTYSLQKKEMKEMGRKMDEQLKTAKQDSANQEKSARQQNKKLNEKLKLAKLDSQIQAFSHFSNQSEKQLNEIIYKIIYFLGIRKDNSLRHNEVEQNEILTLNQFCSASENNIIKVVKQMNKKQHAQLNDTIAINLSGIDLYHFRRPNKLDMLCNEYLDIYDSLAKQADNLDDKIDKVTHENSNYKLLYPSRYHTEIKDNINELKKFMNHNDVVKYIEMVQNNKEKTFKAV